MPPGRPEALVELDRCNKLWDTRSARCGEGPSAAMVNNEVEPFKQPYKRDKTNGVYPGLPPEKVKAGGVKEAVGADPGVPRCAGPMKSKLSTSLDA